MKRILFSGLLAGLIGIGAFTLADAQGGGQRGRGPGGPGFGGFGRGGFARFADLTDEQKQQVQAILEADRAARQAPPAGRHLRRDLETELLADAPDDQKIDALRQQILQAQGEELSRHVALQRKIAQVLTPEQRAKARERLAEGPRSRGERGQAGEGRSPRPQAF
jgi:Spy/CpxP family protein refolding chaperone